MMSTHPVGEQRTVRAACVQCQNQCGVLVTVRGEDEIVRIEGDRRNPLGIAEGDPVYIETPEGRVQQRAKLFEGIHPRVVHADGHWWYPEMPGEDPCLFGVWESNINAIAPGSSEMFDYEGDNPLRALLCRVYRAE